MAGQELRRQHRRFEWATLGEWRDADADARWRGEIAGLLADARRQRQAAGGCPERLLRRSVREDRGRLEVQEARGSHGPGTVTRRPRRNPRTRDIKTLRAPETQSR